MNDLISRQAAIDQIKYLMDDKTKVHYNHGCADAISTLNGIPTAQQWIHVSERLPEMAGIYLVTNSMIGYDELEVTYFEDGQWDTVGIPIAWMPLPEPCKEVKDD